MKRQPITTIRFTEVTRTTKTHVLRLRGTHEYPSGDLQRREFIRRLKATVKGLAERTSSTGYYGGRRYGPTTIESCDMDAGVIEVLAKTSEKLPVVDLHPGDPPSITVDVHHAICHGATFAVIDPLPRWLHGVAPNGSRYRGTTSRYGNLVTVLWRPVGQQGPRFRQTYYLSSLRDERQRCLDAARRIPTKKAKP
jgi:hypothetical protein